MNSKGTKRPASYSYNNHAKKINTGPTNKINNLFDKEWNPGNPISSPKLANGYPATRLADSLATSPDSIVVYKENGDKIYSPFFLLLNRTVEQIMLENESHWKVENKDIANYIKASVTKEIYKKIELENNTPNDRLFLSASVINKAPNSFKGALTMIVNIGQSGYIVGEGVTTEDGMTNNKNTMQLSVPKLTQEEAQAEFIAFTEARIVALEEVRDMKKTHFITSFEEKNNYNSRSPQGIGSLRNKLPTFKEGIHNSVDILYNGQDGDIQKETKKIQILNSDIDNIVSKLGEEHKKKYNEHIAQYNQIFLTKYKNRDMLPMSTSYSENQDKKISNYFESMAFSEEGVPNSASDTAFKRYGKPYNDNKFYCFVRTIGVAQDTDRKLKDTSDASANNRNELDLYPSIDVIDAVGEKGFIKEILVSSSIKHDKNATDKAMATKEYNALHGISTRNDIPNKNRENLLATMMHLGKQAFPNGVRVYNQELNKMIKIGDYDKIKNNIENIVAYGRVDGATQRVNNMIDKLATQKADASKIIAFLSKTKEEKKGIIIDAVEKVKEAKDITKSHFKTRPQEAWGPTLP